MILSHNFSYLNSDVPYIKSFTVFLNDTKNNGNHIKEPIKCNNYNMKIRKKWEPNFKSKSKRLNLYDLCLTANQIVLCHTVLKKAGLVRS